MDGKLLARIGAVVFVGAAITATAIEMTRTPEEPEAHVAGSASDAAMVSARPVLRRCRDIGEAATRDAICLKAWADNRDRFLKQDVSATNAVDAMRADDPIRKEIAPADAPAEQEAR